jgi:hypothetical protein
MKMTSPTIFLSKYHIAVSVLPILTAQYFLLRDNRSCIQACAITERIMHVSAYGTRFSSTLPYFPAKGELGWVEFIETTPTVVWN